MSEMPLKRTVASALLVVCLLINANPSASAPRGQQYPNYYIFNAEESRWIFSERPQGHQLPAGSIGSSSSSAGRGAANSDPFIAAGGDFIHDTLNPSSMLSSFLPIGPEMTSETSLIVVTSGGRLMERSLIPSKGWQWIHRGYVPTITPDAFAPSLFRLASNDGTVMLISNYSTWEAITPDSSNKIFSNSHAEAALEEFREHIGASTGLPSSQNNAANSLKLPSDINAKAIQDAEGSLGNKHGLSQLFQDVLGSTLTDDDNLWLPVSQHTFIGFNNFSVSPASVIARYPSLWYWRVRVRCAVLEFGPYLPQTYQFTITAIGTLGVIAMDDKSTFDCLQVGWLLNDDKAKYIAKQMVLSSLFFVTESGRMMEAISAKRKIDAQNIDLFDYVDHGKAFGTPIRSAPVPLRGGSTVFCIGKNGRLFERSNVCEGDGSSSCSWRWVDHRFPMKDGVASRLAYNNPVVIHQRSLFVLDEQGNLHERHSNNGAEWNWQEHETMKALGSAILSIGAPITSRSFFAISARGHLFERLWDGGRWTWRAHEL